jgi:hypothetical protein
MAASDKDHLWADLSEFLDCRINGPNEYRLAAMNCEPVCELDPKIRILFHNHHTSSRAVLPDRHQEISFHVWSQLPTTVRSIRLFADHTMSSS